MDNRIQIFYRQYLQQVDVEKLSFPEDSVLLQPGIQTQMFHSMFKSHFMFPSEVHTGVYLPTQSYQKRFLKELIRRLEAAIRNPDQDVRTILLFPFPLFVFFFLAWSLIWTIF